VPGIDFSNDPLLQGRLFSYLDTQLSRLGSVNFNQLPINAPKCPFQNFQRDGHMQHLRPRGRTNFEPNATDSGPRECPAAGFHSYAEAAEKGASKLRTRPESFADHYSQARLFFRSLDAAEQAHLASALVFELSQVETESVRTRVLANLGNVDTTLVQRVADGLGVPVPAVSPSRAAVRDAAASPALRVINGPLDLGLPKGRAVGILVHDGSAHTVVRALRDAVVAAGAQAVVIALKIGGVKLDDGSHMKADAQLFGAPSVRVGEGGVERACDVMFAQVLYDAVAVVLSKDAVATMADESAAVQFVCDAFAHLKTIAYNADAILLLDKAGVKPDEGIIELKNDTKSYVSMIAKRHWAREPSVRTLA
jgi:catalase